MHAPARQPASPLPVLAAVLSLVVALILVDRLQQPPAPVVDVDAAGFSAQRAMRHVERLASTPRPTGSQANAAARTYIADVLADLGLTVERQALLMPFEYPRRGGAAGFAFVENIVAHWPGREPGPALVLMSHHDTRAETPGAADAASGVAVLLETVRAVVREGPLRNDLVVLITDGEEIGLFGAQAYFHRHPRAADTGLVLNFDARGSRGPVAMFETGGDNGALVRALADVVERPYANSLVYALYRQMPNDTDLSIAKAAGHAGMNFAFVHGLFDYHAPTDTATHLSVATLQHAGDYALPLVRHFGAGPLPPPPAPDRHYFNPLGFVFVHYPPWLDRLAVLLAAVFAAVAAWRQRRRVTGRAVLRAAAALPVIVVVSLLIVAFLHDALGGARGAEAQAARLARQGTWLAIWALLGGGSALALLATAIGGRGRQAAAVAGVVAVLLALAAGSVVGAVMALIAACLLWALLGRACDAVALGLAALGWLLLAALAMVLWLPGGAWVLLWPVLALAIAQAADGGRRALIGWLGALPALLLLGQAVLTFDQLLGFAQPVASVLPLLLLLLLLAPLLVRPGALPVAAAALSTGVALLIVVSVQDPFDARHPRPLELFVLHEAGHGTAWVSSDRRLHDWHRHRLGHEPLHAAEAAWSPGAILWHWRRGIDAAPPIDAPALALIDDRVVGGQRHLRLQLSMEGGADAIALFLPPTTPLDGWAVNGQPLQRPPPRGPAWWRLRGFALPAEGVEIELRLAAAAPLPEVVLSAVRDGLPPGLTLPARSPTQMRRPHGHADSTVSVRRIDLGALAAPTAGLHPSM